MFHLCLMSYVWPAQYLFTSTTVEHALRKPTKSIPPILRVLRRMHNKRHFGRLHHPYTSFSFGHRYLPDVRLGSKRVRWVMLDRAWGRGITQVAAHAVMTESTLQTEVSGPGKKGKAREHPRLVWVALFGLQGLAGLGRRC